MTRMTRTIALAAGAVAIAGMGSLTACTTKEKPAETKPGSSAPVAPTEKANVGSFAPSVTAHPAPTALPGNVKTGQ